MMRHSKSSVFVGAIAIIAVGFVGWYVMEGPGEEPEFSIEVDDNGIEVND